MYHSGIYITDPIGNNEFSYKKRIDLGSKGKIWIPNIKEGTVDDLEIGSEIVFEEVENGKLVSCKGLKEFIHTTYQGISTYIFDNHNHALFFRYRHTKKLMTPLTKGEGFKPFTVIHIDQHADTKDNKNSFDAKHTSPHEVADFTNYACNVGNFLTSAKQAGIIDNIIQIRSENALHTIEKLDFQTYNYIIDIDVDFWEDKSPQEIESDIQIIKKLFNNACLITIATSPYFFNQEKAIELTKKLLQ